MSARNRRNGWLLLAPWLVAFSWPEPAALAPELPASEWTQPPPRLEFVYARPWPLPDLHLGGVRGSLPTPPELSLSWRAAWLKAGAVRSWRAGIEIGGESDLGWLRAGLAQEEIRVGAIERRRKHWLLGSMGLPWGPLLLAVRLAQEFDPASDAPPARAVLAARWTARDWAAALQRVGSPWGEPPRWELGFVVGAPTGAALGLQWAERGSAVVVRLTHGARVQRLSVVLDGPQSGAVAFSLGWWP